MRYISYLLAGLFLAALTIAPPAEARVDGAKASTAVTVVDRDTPRVPGGSGCDDPDDLIEHPECRGG